MKIKNIGIFATVALLTGSLNIVQAEAKKRQLKRATGRHAKPS